MQYAAIVSLVQNISSVFSPLLWLLGMDRERMSRRMRRRTDGQSGGGGGGGGVPVQELVAFPC
jgi:hypothetical protein